MFEETEDNGMLTDAPARGPGVDPLDAVLAVAQPRAEAGPAPREDIGLVVETRVRAEPAPAAEHAAEGGRDEADPYGELEWPDGYVADPAAMAKFLPLAKKIGLGRDAAQELARLYADLDAERGRAQADFVAKNNAEWLREIQSHPEFGGRNLQGSGESVAAVLRRYGSPLLLTQIRQMNVQNWPEMFYFLARVSRAVSEDCSPSGSGDVAAKTTAQLLFPGLD